MKNINEFQFRKTRSIRDRILNIDIEDVNRNTRFFKSYLKD